MDLVGLKVKILLKKNGHALYPDFNSLPAVVAAGMDWAQYVDVYGLGWHYDQTSGHDDDTPDSPRGMQWGLIVVPEDFADQAAAAFPAECTKLTEVELEDFYDTRAHVYESDELFDQKQLDGIAAKQALGLPLTPHQLKAIDPNDPTPGIRKNPRKTWKDWKKQTGTKIKAQ